MPGLEPATRSTGRRRPSVVGTTRARRSDGGPPGVR